MESIIKIPFKCFRVIPFCPRIFHPFSFNSCYKTMQSNNNQLTEAIIKKCQQIIESKKRKHFPKLFIGGACFGKPIVENNSSSNKSCLDDIFFCFKKRKIEKAVSSTNLLPEGDGDAIVDIDNASNEAQSIEVSNCAISTTDTLYVAEPEITLTCEEKKATTHEAISSTNQLPQEAGDNILINIDAPNVDRFIDANISTATTIDAPFVTETEITQETPVLKEVCNKIKKKSKDKFRKGPSSPRPNYFVAVQVSNPEITQALSNVQQHIQENNPLLSPAFVPIATSHLTLLVFYVPPGDKEALDRACEATSQALECIKEELNASPVTLTFSGLGHFSNQVLFANLTEGSERLNTLASHLRRIFLEQNVTLTDSKESFTPHLTLMKLSKAPRLFKQGIKKISPLVYKDFKEHHFGQEEIKSLQVLSMMDRKDEFGYYKCVLQLPFDS